MERHKKTNTRKIEIITFAIVAARSQVVEFQRVEIETSHKTGFRRDDRIRDPERKKKCQKNQLLILLPIPKQTMMEQRAL